MASPDAGSSSNNTSTNPINVPNQLATQPAPTTPSSSTPLELSNLRSQTVSDAPESSTEPFAREDQFHTPAQSPTFATSQAGETAMNNPSEQQHIDTTPALPLKREQTAPAIGPSSDRPTPLPKEVENDKVLTITLLLTSGARHPYKIDEKYLKKRNVSVEGNNPVNLSIYDLKNLIWREWRDEWESRPTNPTSIRLIYAGHMPGDSTKLGDCRFALGPTAHVVHMTVKPQDFVDDEEAGKGGGRDRDGSERSPRCRCVVM